MSRREGHDLPCDDLAHVHLGYYSGPAGFTASVPARTECSKVGTLMNERLQFEIIHVDHWVFENLRKYIAWEHSSLGSGEWHHGVATCDD